MTRTTPVRTIPGVACGACGGTRVLPQHVRQPDGSYADWCGDCLAVGPELVPKQSDSLQARLRRGERLDALDSQTAERQLRRRVALDPTSRDAARLLAEVRRQMGDTT